ncbi:hypothetical protein BRARA_H02279 [Brassica rapa]|uniref:Uncharacterized protein n=1 Tax=Brassica campestris TaxID=3711 RepID=A0A397YDV6_BRACM|nr:hypothetical protein BRARA_H02279 [Brassica rapa]
MHAASVTVAVAVAGRLRTLIPTRGGEGRDNGFQDHGFNQLSFNGDHTRCFFSHLPIRRRVRTFSSGTHF